LTSPLDETVDQPVREIRAADAAARLQQEPRPLLLDCREPEELTLARIAGALHIPMGDTAVRLKEIDPEREIIVFCHHGVRSRSVAAWLTSQGYESVASMTGGIHAWSREVDPGVPMY
jgi:rhodanese-related sulfurtransferase